MPLLQLLAGKLGLEVSPHSPKNPEVGLVLNPRVFNALAHANIPINANISLGKAH